MRITGLDLSLTSTGVAHFDTDVPGEPVITTRRVIPHAKLGTRHKRLACLLSELSGATSGSVLTVLEGPAFGMPQRQHALGGLWWLVAHGLWRSGRVYAVIPPSSLKRYMTGKGNAGKDEMLLAVAKRYPAVELEGNDDADALALAVMAADYLGLPVARLPEAQRSELERVSWPEQVSEWREVMAHGSSGNPAA